MGKSTINVVFSIAMLNYQRVTRSPRLLPKELAVLQWLQRMCAALLVWELGTKSTERWCVDLVAKYGLEIGYQSPKWVILSF